MLRRNTISSLKPINRGIIQAIPTSLPPQPIGEATKASNLQRIPPGVQGRSHFTYFLYLIIQIRILAKEEETLIVGLEKAESICLSMLGSAFAELLDNSLDELFLWPSSPASHWSSRGCEISRLTNKHLFSVHANNEDGEPIGEASLPPLFPLYNVDVDVAKNVVKDKGEIVAKLKFAKAGKPAITAAVVELNKEKENLSRLK
ncbi:hypothetical protein Tco_0006914 [Tanacetum coccineum]